ncbi:MAG: ABC transporter substrate-binding protein [Nocardioidaceae bacterium]
MANVRRLAVAASAVTLLTLSACGGGDSLEGSDNSASQTSDQGSLTLSGQSFTEAAVMAAMYEQVLVDAGYDVTSKLVETRDVYVKQMSDGKVDVAPDYLAGIADFLNIQQNGEDAEPITSNDTQESLTALEPLAEAAGITMLEPSEATSQNAFFVTKAYADENSVTTLSDLAEVGPIKLAAAPDCVGRDDCEKGLKGVYGIDITEVVPLGYASAQTKDAVINGEVELGQTGTTDGTLEAQDLVLLEDDMGIQPAQNLVPAVNSEFLQAHPDIEAALNELSSTLTTEDLANLNAKVDVERQDTSDVAAEYLQEKGLI